MLSKDEFELVRDDVAIVRAPPVSTPLGSVKSADRQSDGLLGCIMQGAWVGTQLSTREGFEVKVTEVSEASPGA
jgi:hypothetical protein